MSRQHLLLVDSDQQSLQLMEVSLRKAGFHVTASADGADALAKARDAAPDLVLTEVDLPGLDGFGLLTGLRGHAETASVPVVFLTQDTRVDRRMKALELGVADYLSKPIYVKEVVARVRIHLQKRERDQLKDHPGADQTGTLADMGLVDLVRSLGGLTGIVHCHSPRGETATLWVTEGRVVDAELGRLWGEYAFYRVLNWADGSWHLQLQPHERPSRIERDSPALLAEGLTRLDEWTRLLEQLGGIDTVYEVDFVALAFRLGDIPDEVNAALRLLDGRRDLRRVVEESPFEDNATLALVLRLRAEGIIRVAWVSPAAAASRPESWATRVPEAESHPSMVTEHRAEVRSAVPLGEDGRPLRGAALARALAGEARRRQQAEVAPPEPAAIVPAPAAPAPVFVAAAPPPVAAPPAPTPVFLAPVAPAVAPPAAVEAPQVPEKTPVSEPAPDVTFATAWAGETVPETPVVAAGPSKPCATCGASNAEEASSCSACGTSFAGPSIDLAGLLAAEGPSAPPERDTHEAIPVVRYPNRKGARRDRLAHEAAQAAEKAAKAGLVPVPLAQEVLPPGARAPSDLVDAIEGKARPADERPTDVNPKVEDAPPAEAPKPQVPEKTQDTPANEDEHDDDLAQYLKGRRSKAPLVIGAAVALLVVIGVLAIRGEEAPTPPPAKPVVAEAPAPKPTEPPVVAPPATPDPAVVPAVGTEAPTPEPAKAEVPKTEPIPEPVAKVEPEPVKPEPVKPEPVKPEPVKPEPVKPEPVAKAEPVKPEPVAKAEPVKPEPAPKAEPAPVAAGNDADFEKAKAEGLAAVKAEKWAKAIPALTKALKIKPDAQAARDLGIAFYNSDKADKAREQLQASAKLNDKDADTYLYLGMVLTDLEKKDDAKKAYRRFLALEPKSSDRAKEIASVLENLDK